jgi:cell division protein FtsZ
VISNDKLRHQYGNLKMKEAFAKADNVLATAAKCITDVINSTGQINVDFADVCTVMSNGGVAILGSATAEGENRAQSAIENALNSPLLNDNDIRGAKWILININSSLGEHEFTMDEVDIIQNYLIGQAGEDTDVILGLGYDNSLGSEISITLIATGFEHKDPFPKQDKRVAPTENKNEKIVMELEMPKAQTILQQPTLQFDLIEEKGTAKAPVQPEVIMEALVKTDAKEIADPFMPVMSETLPSEIPVEILSKNTVEKLDSTPEYFEISSAPDPSPVIEFDLTKIIPVPQKPAGKTEPVHSQNISINKEDASNNGRTLSSGGFLAKPAQIYVEEKPTIRESNLTEEPLPLHKPVQEDEPVIEMQLVVKDSNKAAEEEPIVQQTQPIMMSPVEEPALQDETEDLRRRATERIAKLRNLSFNINAADPNNEFETVPAYLRRNMEMHNQIADVESFYSNYTVKTDDNNQAEISTINTFLDGKKPD